MPSNTLVSLPSQLFTGDELYQAYKYLANYHVLHGRLDDGYRAAQKCMDFPDVSHFRFLPRMRCVPVEVRAPRPCTLPLHFLCISEHSVLFKWSRDTTLSLFLVCWCSST